MFTASTSVSSFTSSCSSKSLSAFVSDVAAAKRIGELTNVAMAARQARSRPVFQKSEETRKRLPELTSVATAARRARTRPTLQATELTGAATAARRARQSRPVYHDGPAKSVPTPSETPQALRVKYGYACQTMPTRKTPPPYHDLQELEVIVFPAPERRSSTLIRMETMLDDLKANGLNAEVIRRNFHRSG